MKINQTRERLRRGETSVGTWLTLPGTSAATLMSRAGFDWLTVELEHAPTSLESASAMWAILSGQGVTPLVRVPSNTSENIKRVLDCGAWGVVVPMVNSRAEAEAVVAAARYAPVGQRSIGGNLHAALYGTTAGQYYARANEQILVVIMIETVAALGCLDSILSVPGIDVVFIGPNDLTHSMGMAPTFESEDSRFRDALRRVVEGARKHGVAPGIHVSDAAMAQRRMAEGFQFIAVTSEAGMMMAKASEVAKVLGLGGGGAAAKY